MRDRSTICRNLRNNVSLPMLFTTPSSTPSAQTGQSSSCTKKSRKVPRCYAKLSPSSWTSSSSQFATNIAKVSTAPKCRLSFCTRKRPTVLTIPLQKNSFRCNQSVPVHTSRLWCKRQPNLRQLRLEQN